MAILVLLASKSPCEAQSVGSYEQDRQAAYQLFHRGRISDSAAALTKLLPQASDIATKLAMQRDILEICTAAYDTRCVYETIQAMLPPIAADRRFVGMYPEIVLYELKANIWHQNDDYVRDTLKRGGASSIAKLATDPATYAEVQLALHTYHVRKNDLVAAEQSLSGAILGLLLSNPEAPHTVSKILIRAIGALINAHDPVGAFQLFQVAGRLIDSTVGRESPLYAEHSANLSRLFAFTSLNGTTASLLTQSIELFGPLQINDEVKAYETGAANSLGSAALVLDGKLDKAKALHAAHPMQKQRDAIVARGQFATATEFYFAVSDIFLESLDAKPDQRWRPLFEKEVPWNLDSLQLGNLNSYRSFSLGLLAMGRGERQAGQRLLFAAAKQRIDNFEDVMRANFEGFQLPSAVDRILVATGLTAASGMGGDEAFNLMLRGGEFLGRTLRDTLGDVAVLLGSQADDGARKDAHSYIHLLRQKREWEIERIKKFIAKEPEFTKNKGTLVRQYAEVVDKLAELKTRLTAGGRLERAKGLPSLEAVQKNLSEREAFVTYFPKIDGMGKLCIRRDSAAFSTAPYELPTTLGHIRLLQFATAADHAPDIRLDKQYPVEAAIYLRDYLFGGLDACITPGTHVIVALPPEFAGVSLGALLAKSPPRDGAGFDLWKAEWLIKQMSFSVVTSARQYLAALPLEQRPVAPRAFLGIGDPELAPAKLAASAGSLKIPNGLSDLHELPETADELRAAARMFAASDGDVMLKRSATEAAFRLRPLAEYDVIHFSTHGLIREDLPGLAEAALVLTPESAEDPSKDGLLTVSELSRMNFGARLVVLSACNTAKYDLTQAGIGIQDFQTAFMIGGAPTVLAALWPIESITARDLVTQFFRQWRSPAVPYAADALATATRMYLASADAAHQHPRFWAAFQIAGYGHVRGTPAK